MFIETHPSSETNGIPLVFIKSLNVQAFPCGRRRGFVDKDGDTDTTVNDQYYIPFDPEARLNTEANNRRHSGLNGFTETYLKEWDEEAGQLVLSLAGYLFRIKLDKSTSEASDYASVANFVSNFLNTRDTAGSNIFTDADKIYANIRIEETALYSGFTRYNTSVLRNQSKTEDDIVNIDILKTFSDNNQTIDTSDRQNPENYYFSGLSFSVRPLTGDNEHITRSSKVVPRENQLPQQVISLCILEKIDNTWQIHQPALLPKIEHGNTTDSISVGDLTTHDIHADGYTIDAENINAKNLDLVSEDGTKTSIPALRVTYDGSTKKYQLHFSNVDMPELT